MAFTLYELATHPEVQDKLRKEIHNALNESDNKITYDMVSENAIHILLPAIKELLNERDANNINIIVKLYTLLKYLFMIESYIEFTHLKISIYLTIIDIIDICIMCDLYILYIDNVLFMYV